MSSIGSITGTTGGGTPPAGAARVQGDASAELAKLECQLSDWVHCPSSKTSAGKAHIAEITQKIDAIKAQAKHAAKQHTPAAAAVQSVSSARSAGSGVRLDGLGTRLDVQA